MMEFSVWILGLSATAERVFTGDAERAEQITRDRRASGTAFAHVVTVPSFVDMQSAAPTREAFRRIATGPRH